MSATPSPTHDSRADISSVMAHGGEVPPDVPCLTPEPNRDFYNGVYTVVSPTGNHRTFSLETQPADDTFAPGERILYLLTGPDEWTGFAFARAGRTIQNHRFVPGFVVWKKYRSQAGYPPSAWELFARMLADMLRCGAREFRSAALNGPGVYRLLAMKSCDRCNRRLSTPESIAAGRGPECSKK